MALDGRHQQLTVPWTGGVIQSQRYKVGSLVLVPSDRAFRRNPPSSLIGTIIILLPGVKPLPARVAPAVARAKGKAKRFAGPT